MSFATIKPLLCYWYTLKRNGSVLMAENKVTSRPVVRSLSTIGNGTGDLFDSTTAPNVIKSLFSARDELHKFITADETATGLELQTIMETIDDMHSAFSSAVDSVIANDLGVVLNKAGIQSPAPGNKYNCLIRATLNECDPIKWNEMIGKRFPDSREVKVLQSSGKYNEVLFRLGGAVRK